MVVVHCFALSCSSDGVPQLLLCLSIFIYIVAHVIVSVEHAKYR